MTHEQNERLRTLLSEYLCFQPDAIAPADVAAFSADAHLPQEDAYRMLLSAKLGLDPDRAEDWLLIRDALPKIIRHCDPADYAQDEYLRRIAPVSGQHGHATLTQDVILPMELFVRDDFLPLDDGTCLPQLGWFDTSFRFPAVKENNRHAQRNQHHSALRPPVARQCAHVRFRAGLLRLPLSFEAGCAPRDRCRA